MKTKPSLDDVLAEARAEMALWSPQMKQMVELRRRGLEYVAAEERPRGETANVTATSANERRR